MILVLAGEIIPVDGVIGHAVAATRTASPRIGSPFRRPWLQSRALELIGWKDHHDDNADRSCVPKLGVFNLQKTPPYEATFVPLLDRMSILCNSGETCGAHEA
jgi:hypothetical protein